MTNDNHFVSIQQNYRILSVLITIGIGEILEGYELRNSGVKMHWATDVDNEVVCDMKLNAEQAQHFSEAVDQQYWYVYRQYYQYSRNMTIVYFLHRYEQVCSSRIWSTNVPPISNVSPL